MIFIFLFYKQDKRGNKLIEETNTILVEGRIARKVEIEKGRKNKKSLELRLRSYPYFIFKLGNTGLKALNETKFISAVKKGQPIKLRIWKEAYEKKLLQSKQLNFRDKHFNFHSIEILGIQKFDIDYLTIDAINKSRENFHTKGNYYGLLAFAILGIGLGLFLLFSSFKIKQ